MRKLALLVTLAASPAFGAETTGGDVHIVLDAVYGSHGKPEKMLVFIPGGDVPNEHYRATALAIQAAAVDLRLWVVIPAVSQRLCIISCSATSLCSPLHLAVESALGVAKDNGWKRGIDVEDLWLAGHSLGGVCANTLFQAYSSASSFPYAGLVVMGSYVDKSGNHSLTNYPKPVLTLNVELDGGIARPGKTSIWWRQHLASKQKDGEEYAVLNKPVVVVAGLNHSDFCPGFDVPGDLRSEVEQAVATAEIGRVFAAFLHLHTASVAADSKAKALGIMREKLAWTEQLMTPYLTAQDMELLTDAAGTSSPFCVRAQHVVAGLSPEDDKRLDVTDGYQSASPSLMHCHPSATVADGHVKVVSCSHADYYADIDNTGGITAASEVACKLMGGDKVAKLLNTTALKPKVDCREINKYAVDVAESLASTSTLQRYRRSGRAWCFQDDVPIAAGPLWVFSSSLKLAETATCMSVASPAMDVPLGSLFYPGNHYCKVLSPARVLDWMMTDSLKPGKKLEHELVADQWIWA